MTYHLVDVPCASSQLQLSCLSYPLITHLVGPTGWNETTATNAPVQDETVQAVLGMNQKHILLPCPGIF